MLQEIFNIHLKEDLVTNVVGINKKVQAEYVWNLFAVKKCDLIVVTNTIYEANLLYKNLSYSHDKVYFYPMDDFLVSESLAISPDLKSIRIDTLNEISSCKENKILITNLMGYLRFLPSLEIWKKYNLKIKINDVINKKEIIEKLDKLGYEKESIVTKTGEYSSRGYILDIFPYGEDNPIRIEFFDDEIESIRHYDIDSQLSTEKIDDFTITPFTEFINDKNVKDIPDRQSLLPRVLDDICSIKNYLNNCMTVIIDFETVKTSYEKLLLDIMEFKETDVYNIDNYMFDLYELLPNDYINLQGLDNVSNKSDVVYNSKEIDSFNGNYKQINTFIKQNLYQKKKVILVLEDDHIIASVLNYLEVDSIITNFNDIKKGIVNIIKDKMYNGFILNDYVILTSNELFKKNTISTYRNKFKYATKIKDINKLQKGDYVVHIIHGIGKYLGITTLTTNGLKKDYLNLEYKNGDKLYVPVEKIELISKFSSNEGIVPKISKLGGSDWYKQKLKVKSKVHDIAAQLLKTSAQRKLLAGFSFLKDDEEQVIFDNNFEFIETKDQLRAINEIKQDMEKPQPMDRLLCGDVGYGKTEVAFRAIFKAIKSGKQVAFLCPTTILSKQHFENAIERFNGFGVNIEVLNRFQSITKKNEILKGLESGKIDLIIGTHRLLSKDVKFKDLGLLVIDEEQRFGVTHKEKIKELKQNIDVLTLSATPIPRTLQMSLTGMKGLSLIETPPVDRYPIQTYVLKENEKVIKDAIYKEMSRDGQVFILSNKISNIEDQVVRVKKLVPEAKVTYIHGRMNKEQIESTMEAFTNREFNVLVCTTIIETGIDITNANTLIILDADHFGLSQLYQIRGRIGRGTNIGYAYLMYDKNKELNDIAIKRLSAIKEFTELGSGYHLAMRDLAIRGAGDILGSEQSGFIDTVGYDLYLKILNEEVEKLKGNIIDDEQIKEEKPFLQVSTHVDDFYADTEDLKIEIHKIINNIDSIDKYNKIKEELEDRFGSLSDDLLIYMQEELFQYMARKKGVVKVDQFDRKIDVYFNEFVSNNSDMIDLLSKLYKLSTNFSVNHKNNVLKITLSLTNLDNHFTYYLIKMLEIIE